MRKMKYIQVWWIIPLNISASLLSVSFCLPLSAACVISYERIDSGTIWDPSIDRSVTEQNAGNGFPLLFCTHHISGMCVCVCVFSGRQGKRPSDLILNKWNGNALDGKQQSHNSVWRENQFRRQMQSSDASLSVLLEEKPWPPW